MEAHSAQMVTRIGFAERWLHRARTQCADGDVVGGLLTLALADAEVRYALEAAGIQRAAVTDAVPAARLRPAWMLAAVASVLAVAWLSLSGAGPTDARIAEGPPVIRFARVGSLLASTAVPSVQTAGPADGGGHPTAAVRAAPAAASVDAQPNAAASPAASGRSGPVPVPQAAASGTPAAAAFSAAPGAAAPVALSEADLIEMVIAATRALQGTGP